MFLITITAVAAVCGAAKLDRAYLPPPPSAKLAGGSPGSLQTPFIGNSINQRIGGIPKGGYTNDFEGVVVEAVAPGTRASSPDDTNLGAPRITYGSIYSKVGEDAFKLDPVDGIRHLPKDSHAGLNKESETENGKHDFRNINKIPNSEAIERTQAAQDRLAETIRSENEMSPNGYKYSFETNNGILVQENAIESEGVQAMGHFAYKSDDGQIYSVSYTADSNGFKPVGDHIPTPPPIPKEILDSLEQNARDEAAGLVDDGSYDAQKYNTGGDYNQRGEANGQYNDKQLLNNEERPELLTNGEVLNQNNRHFGSQKLTQVQFGFNKNLNRPSTENNKRNQSNQDNFNYENRYTEKEKNDYNANLVTSFDKQHKNYNEPIGSSVHFPAKIKLTDRNQNIPLQTYSQTPLSLSVTASGNKLSSYSNYHMSNKENSPHTFAYNNIVNRNNGAQEQGHSGVGIVSNQNTPESILTTPHESSPTQNNNHQESQNGFSFKHFTANHKMSTSVVPNSSQKDLQFNSRPNTLFISGSSSELTQPLFSSQIFKTQENMKLSNNFNKSPELGLKGNRFLENYRTQETLDNGFQNSNKGNILTSQNYQIQNQYDRTSHLSNIKIQDFQNIPRNQYKPILPQTAHNQNSYSSSLKGDSYYYNPTSTSINIPQDQHPKFDIGSNSKTQFTEQNFLTTPSHSKTELEHETASHIRPTKEFIVPTFPLKMKEKYQGIILQSQVNGITQASALPLNSRLQSFSTLQSNNLGMQQIQKDSSTVSLPSNKFPLKQHVGQGFPQIQPNYSQETIVPSSQYTGELYQYNKPPETMPAPSNTDTNSKFTSELYVYNKPPETLQTPPDMTQKQLQQLSQAKDVHSSIPNTQIHKPTSLFIPTTSQKVSEKLTLENGNHETHHRQQCCQESYNSHNDLSQSPMKTENQGFSSQYQIPGQSFVGQGEVFSGPREIPRFDSSGYHY